MDSDSAARTHHSATDSGCILPAGCGDTTAVNGDCAAGTIGSAADSGSRISAGCLDTTAADGNIAARTPISAANSGFSKSTACGGQRSHFFPDRLGINRKTVALCHIDAAVDDQACAVCQNQVNLAADGDPAVDGHIAVDHIPAALPFVLLVRAACNLNDIVRCLFTAVCVQIGYTIYKSVCFTCKEGKEVVQLLRTGDFGFLLLGQLLIGCMGCPQFFINRLLFLGGHRFQFLRCGQSVNLLLNRLHLFVRFFALALAQVGIFCAAHRAFPVDRFGGANLGADAHSFFLRRCTLALAQVAVLCATHRAVQIGITLCTEGNTGALLLCAAVLRVADFTDEGAGSSRHFLGVAALAVVFVTAVQCLCDTAAFFAALVGTRSRLSIFRIGWDSCVVRYAFCQVAVLSMLVDALGHKGIAVLVVFMGTGRPLDALSIAAVGCVLRVVFA